VREAVPQIVSLVAVLGVGRVLLSHRHAYAWLSLGLFFVAGTHREHISQQQ
jgi:hypothetical protein